MISRTILSFAVFASLAGSAAYVLAMSLGWDAPQGDPSKRFPEAAVTSYGNATDAVVAVPETSLVEEARVPFPPRNVTPPGVYTGPVRRSAPPASSETAEEELSIATRSFRRVVVEEAGLLRAGDTRIRLADVTAPGLDATCTDASGDVWPCGRRAMAALRLLLRHRPLDCEISQEDAGQLIGRCRVGDRDIAAWLVEQGWAEPDDSGRYQPEFEAARAAERGMFEMTRAAAPPVSIPVSNVAAD